MDSNADDLAALVDHLDQKKPSTSVAQGVAVKPPGRIVLHCWFGAQTARSTMSCAKRHSGTHTPSGRAGECGQDASHVCESIAESGSCAVTDLLSSRGALAPAGLSNVVVRYKHRAPG